MIFSNKYYVGIFVASFLLIHILIIIFINVQENKEYCNLPSCKGKKHSMCIYSASPISKCGKCYQVGLKESEIKEIVNIHNKLRQHVANGEETRGNPGPQPAAAPGAMLSMVWNEELSNIAQRWANQCQRGHDECRNTPTMMVGQNAASETNTLPENIKVTNMVQRWYDEVDQFDKNIVKSYRFEFETGHYTQLVWGDSKELGCGYIKCDLGNRNHMGQLICNYGPTGNILRKPIYKT